MSLAEDPIIAGHAAWWDAYDNDLYRAIGRVATASAMLDEALAELLDELAGTEVMWRITIGQSTDWLIQSCRLVLDEVDPYFRKFPHAQHETFLALLAEAGQLRGLRNYVVHGTWSTDRNDEQTRPRPWGDVANGSVLYVSRARNRRGYEEHAMTIGDVNRLADELARVRDDLANLYRTMRPGFHPKHPPLPRWGRYDLA